jgi:hypothetical protein
VSKASAARRLATAAAYGGGGLGVVGGAVYGLLKVQAKLARRAIGPADSRPPKADGTYGRDLLGNPISLLILGDSAAAGYGMTDRLDTPAAMMGEGLAAITDRPVRVTSRAFVGARSANLDAQIDAGLQADPDVAPGDAVLPVSFAAVEAADVAGTEVSPVQVAGSDRGPRGRWAQLRHRRRALVPSRVAPTPGRQQTVVSEN